MHLTSRSAALGVRLALVLATLTGIGLLSRLGSGWPTPALAAGTIPLVCPIYHSSDVPKAIPDNVPAGVTSTLTIAAPGQRVTNVSVRLNSITHTFVGDLRLRLTAPNQTVVTLIGDPGVLDNSGHDFYGTTLDDKFPTSILNGTAPFTGGFRPVAPLAPVRGQLVAGTWQLQVADVFVNDVGVLEAWSLEICSLPDRLWLPLVLR